MSKVKPGDDLRQRAERESFKHGEKPWKRPVEKEQRANTEGGPDLEKWQESDTH